MANSWQALQVRATTFHSSVKSHSESGDGLASVFDVEPDAIEVKPPEFRRTEVGVLGVGRLNHTTVLNRVDWVWHYLEESEPPLSTLGEAGDVLDHFLPRIRKWLSTQTDVVRIALGGQFGIPVESREAGYVKLGALIDEVRIDPQTSDFLYQINRPTKTTLGEAELPINQVEKWGCRAVTKGSFNIALGSGLAMPGESSVVARFASVELDYNSDATSGKVLSAPEVNELMNFLEARIREFLTREA